MGRTTSRRTIWILGDQLTPAASSLAGVAPGEAAVLMIESQPRAHQRPYHDQQPAVVWSAMRHFAGAARSRGFAVDDQAAQPDYRGGLRAHLARQRPTRRRPMDTAEHGAATRLRALAEAEGLTVQVTPHSPGLTDRACLRRGAWL